MPEKSTEPSIKNPEFVKRLKNAETKQALESLVSDFESSFETELQPCINAISVVSRAWNAGNISDEDGMKLISRITSSQTKRNRIVN